MLAFFRRLPLTIAAFALLGASVVRATGPAAWKAQTEFGFRLTHDSNVFLQDDTPAASGAAAPSPARADTLITNASAMLALAGPLGAAGRLSIDYRAEFVRFDDYVTENHDDHRLRAALAGKQDAWAWDASAQIFVVDGTDLGPVYTRRGGGPVIGGEPVRSRRDQTNTKAALRATRTQEGGWWRILGAGLYQDFHTQFSPPAAPYVDRGEFSAGLELGRDLRPGLAVVAGARAGRQIQADLPAVPDRNSTNELLRILLGLEGKPSPSLAVDFRAGPDFRHFSPDEPAVLGRDRVAPYAEAAVTWTPTASDTISLCGKHAVWLCSSGRGAYEDSTWELAWKHRISPCLALRASARLVDADSRGQAYPGIKPFHDRLVTTSLGADYRLSKHLVLDASLSHDEGTSLLPDRPGREYARTQVGLGLTASW